MATIKAYGVEKAKASFQPRELGPPNVGAEILYEWGDANFPMVLGHEEEFI